MLFERAAGRVAALVASATLVVPIPASPAETTLSYAVAYDYATGSTVRETDETLTLRRNDSLAIVSLADASGAVLTSPTKIAADGEIVAGATDAGVTCFNMVTASLYQFGRLPNRPSPVLVRVGSGIVPVPLTLRESRQTDGTTAYAGDGVRIVDVQSGTGVVPVTLVVEATMHVSGARLMSAVLSEATSLQGGREVMSRQSCALTALGDVMSG